MKRDIKITANKSNRTFTIRFIYSDGDIIKYRTIKVNKDEFQSMDNMTTRDWEYFLYVSQEYYRVK